MRCNCDCGGGCALAVVGGLIGAIILAFFATVTAPVVLFWIAFGVALLFLVVTVLALLTVDCDEEAVGTCICKNALCLLVGIFLTLIASVVVLILGTVVPLAIFFVAWFFFFAVIAMFLFLLCVVRRLCN